MKRKMNYNRNKCQFDAKINIIISKQIFKKKKIRVNKLTIHSYDFLSFLFEYNRNKKVCS